MLGSLLLLPLVLQAPTVQSPTAEAQRDHEVIIQLLSRVQQLEAEIQELKANRGLPPPVQPAVMPPAD